MYSCDQYDYGYIPVKNVVRHFLKHVGLGIRNQQSTHSGEKPYKYLYSMSQTYPCHRHIPVMNVARHFLKHVGLGISKNENEFST